MLRKILRGLAAVVAGFVVLLTLAYSTTAIAVAPRLPSTAMSIAACVWVVGAVCLFVFVRPMGRALLVWAAAVGAFCLWWFTIPASNEGDWQIDVSRPPRVDWNGDVVTVHDVRNFDWTGANDAKARWEDRTYDLSKLDSGWFAVSYWDNNRAIAHTMLSFGFSDGRYLALSVETRKVNGQEYSTWRGTFKAYTLFYVLADERDVFRVRTNRRDEDMYLYPLTNATKERLRGILTSVLRKADDLAKNPEWYMTIMRSCTSGLVPHIEVGAPAPIRCTDVVLNGYTDELAYRRGGIPHDRPFEEVRAAHRITDAARAAGDDPDFSRKIREKLPPWR
jgi:hypothetical protein